MSIPMTSLAQRPKTALTLAQLSCSIILLLMCSDDLQATRLKLFCVSQQLVTRCPQAGRCASNSCKLCPFS